MSKACKLQKIMDNSPQYFDLNKYKYFGVYEQIVKLQKLPKDEMLKVSDVLTLLEMTLEVLESQHKRIEKLESSPKKQKP